MLKVKLNTLSLTLAAVFGGVVLAGASNQAHAQVSIHSDTAYSTQINEDKFKNIGDAQAKNELRYVLINEALSKLAAGDTAGATAALNQLNGEVLHNGDTYRLYTTKGSIVNADVSHEPVVHVGSGSQQQTAGGVSTIQNVSGTTIAGNNYTFAGGTTSGEVVFGNIPGGKFRTLTGVAAGRLNANSTDVVNGSQLFATNQAIGALADKGISFKDSNGNTSIRKLGDTLTLSNGGDTNTTVEVDAVNNIAKFGLNKNLSITSVTATNAAGSTSKLEGDGFSSGGISIKQGGVTFGDRVVGGVSNGAVNATSKEAVNGSQLFALQQQVNNIAGGGGGGGNPNAVLYDDTTKGSVTLGGAGGTTITNVKAGAINQTSTDAINGSQLHAVQEQINKGLIFAGDTGIVNTQLGDTFKIAGGNNITTSVDPATKTATVGLKNDITVNSVASGGYTVTGSTVTLNANGLNNGGNRITNVADGQNNDDAVNVGQLNRAIAGITGVSNFNQAFTNINNRIDEVEDTAKRGIAAVAAMDIEYPEQRPGQVATGVGVAHYSGKTALGIGTTFLTENGKVKVSAAYGQALERKAHGVGKVSVGIVW